jgi:hypothetical protein
MTLVASITEPPPTATTRSARASRIASRPATTPSRGLCAEIASKLAAESFAERGYDPGDERAVRDRARRRDEHALRAVRFNSSASASATGLP